MKLKTTTVVDPGEGAPLIFRPNLRPEGPKKSFWRPSPTPYLRIWMSNDYWAFSKMGRPLILHSLVLHFPRWRPSQISHPWHVQDVNAFSESNSRGLPPATTTPPPILGQTIDRCIIYQSQVHSISQSSS